MPPTRIERLVSAARTGTAALAVGVALFLLLRVSLVATFRAALIVLAALEVLSFGWRALSIEARPAAAWIEIAVKLAVLAAAYVAVGS